MNPLTTEELAKLEQDAMAVLISSSKMQDCILIKAEDVLSMIFEIRKLRKLANEQALTAAYFMGIEQGKLLEK